MDSGGCLHYLLFKVPSEQLVLQATEAEGFSGEQLSVLTALFSLPSLPYFLILYSYDSIFGRWKSSEAHLLQLPRKKDRSEVTLCHSFDLFDLVSINVFTKK